jgi:Trypsin-like peptidase domain
MMRLALCLRFTIIAAVSISAPVRAQTPDDEFKIYAAGVLNIAPFARPLSGYGVYLGQNAVITAAHVVGRWPLFTDPIISIADRETSAKLVKKGSFPQLDLALLVVSDTALPVDLALRQNPICKTMPSPGTAVVVVSREGVERSHIVSAGTIAPRDRSQFSSLINEPHGSGSGVFDPERRCLLGIMSAAVMKQDDFRTVPDRPYIGHRWDRSVGYFVPASVITNFIPAHLRF